MGYGRVSVRRGESICAVVMEDLGQCMRVSDSLKGMLERGEETRIGSIDAELIGFTVGMVRLGIADPDHSTMNFVLPGENLPVRVDLELARCAGYTFAVHLYASMVGRLIATYTFAVQPHVERAASFARQLVERLCLAKRVLREVQGHVDRELDRQREESGIDVRLRLDS